jgi:hypothetical protein
LADDTGVGEARLHERARVVGAFVLDDDDFKCRAAGVLEHR